MALRSVLPRLSVGWSRHMPSTGCRMISTSAPEPGSGAAGGESKSGPKASPFDIDEDVGQQERPKRWWFPRGKWKRPYIEGTHIMRGWGNRQRSRRVPKHQKDAIVETVYHLRVSPRKLNRMCTIVRRKSLDQAQAQLAVSTLKPARLITNVLDVALERAKDQGWNTDLIRVAELIVGRGVQMKKIRPWHGRGRFGIGIVYRAHLTVVLKQCTEKQYRFLFETSKRERARIVTGGERPEDKKLPRHLLNKRAVIPQGDHIPKPWLIRSQMDITAVG